MDENKNTDKKVSVEKTTNEIKCRKYVNGVEDISADISARVRSYIEDSVIVNDVSFKCIPYEFEENMYMVFAVNNTPYNINFNVNYDSTGEDYDGHSISANDFSSFIINYQNHQQIYNITYTIITN